MTEVVVICEGQTEEAFIKRLVAPALSGLHVYVKPTLMPTSPGTKGGDVNFNRLKNNARNILRGNPPVVLTTLIDLYQLDTSFPEFKATKSLDWVTRLARLEAALHQEIVAHAQCRRERFIPYIQPHEFESLLFSDTDSLVALEPDWNTDKIKRQFKAICEKFDSPEHINNSYETAPSRRLKKLLFKPPYKKTRHGELAAIKMTLATIEQKCPHFKSWMDQLRALATSPT
jgi:Domain of unknown function (DUF4276)